MKDKKFFGYDFSQLTVIGILTVLFLFICVFCIGNKDNNAPRENMHSENQDNNIRDHGDIPHVNKSVFLSKGQSAPIVDSNNNTIKSMVVGVGWSPVRATEYRNDIDSTVILVDSQTKETCEICYYRLKGPNGSVFHHGYNLTGDDAENTFGESVYKDDENIDVYLDKVPLGYDKIYFVLNIFDANARGQTLNLVQDMYINIYNSGDNNLLMNYRVDGNTPGNALILGVATRDVTYNKQLQNADDVAKSCWTFKALGEPYFAEDIKQLCITCSQLQ